MNNLIKNANLFEYGFYALLFLLLITTLKKRFLTHYKKWVEDAVEGVMFYLSKCVKKSLAATFSMRYYCKNLLKNERYKHLHIPSRDNIQLDIDQLFVSLSIVHPFQEEESYTHENLLYVGNRIMVMGDPGAGKSSLIKKMFRNACREGAENPYVAKLPILIELKEVKPTEETIKDYGEWFLQMIKNEVKRNKNYQIEECFDSYAQTNGLLVLLDGLDEVSTSNYEFMKKCINGLSSILSGIKAENKIVLTMRSQYYQQVKNDFFANFPQATFLKPFSPSEIYDFLRRWHFDKDGDRNISRIYSDLTDRPTLREMCGNPLILSMYVAEDKYNNGQASPESRTLFYNKIMDELIINRRRRQLGSDKLSYSKLKEQREKILGEIAYKHLANFLESRNRIDYFQALSVIQKVSNCDQKDAQKIFDEILKETGIISIEQRDETFKFIHLSFCEFLAAIYAAKYSLNGWKKLVMDHEFLLKQSIETNSRLLDTVPFVVGLLKPSETEEALTRIGEFGDDNLLARCFLETKYYEHPIWPILTERMKERISISNAANIDEKWLADLHIFNVVVKDAEIASKAINIENKIDLTEYYRKLIDKNKSIIYQILTAYAKQDAVAVFRICELCNLDLLEDFPQIIIDNCDQIPFLGIVKEKMINEENRCVQWAGVLASSALTKQLVAFTLYDAPGNERLAQKIKLLKYPDLSFGKKTSLLLQCYTLSMQFDGKNAKLNGIDFKLPKMYRHFIFYRKNDYRFSIDYKLNSRASIFAATIVLMIMVSFMLIATIKITNDKYFVAMTNIMIALSILNLLIVIYSDWRLRISRNYLGKLNLLGNFNWFFIQGSSISRLFGLIRGLFR